MRSPSVNHQLNTNKQQINLNEFSINNQFMNYSLSELQEMAIQQQEQIEHNQQLLITREQRLNYLKQRQITQENLRIKYHIEQQHIKQLRLKTLENQINQQKNSNSTFENQLENLKEIYLNKQNELTISLNKVDELTKQLDQLRKCQIIINKEQLLNKNELEKLKQELFTRNRLNEQQNQKIAYQREIFTSKQTELDQLNHRIEELQQNIMKKKFSPSNSFKNGLDIVQNTLNNINIAEIEKRMVQLANSFNSINNSEHLIINHSDSQNKINSISTSISPSKISFASKNEIAATYMTSSPIILTDSSKVEEQLLPPNLRLNDDILSVHFNNITSNIRKRHSISDLNDLLINYLPPNTEQQEPIQVRDDSSDSKSTIIDYENLLDLQTTINKSDDEDEQVKTIIDSIISDTESQGSISEDIQSIISFSTPISPNLKSLLKTSTTPKNTSRHVVFDPLALLLDAAVVGDLELVMKSAKEVKNPSQPNDEGLTALHNAICASNIDCVKYLVEFGCDINYADNDGWTPLHCAASCNHFLILKYLIEHGACIYATTIRDNETAVDKCEEQEENYILCSEYLLSTQNNLGVINNGLVYSLYDYDIKCMDDELEFKNGDELIISRRGDENESEWWWAKHKTTDKEGYIPRNYLGLYPRIQPGTITSTNC